jgi:hypothetical protein
MPLTVSVEWIHSARAVSRIGAISGADICNMRKMMSCFGVVSELVNIPLLLNERVIIFNIFDSQKKNKSER